MKSIVLLKIAKTQFDLSFSMLEEMIDKCPDDFIEPFVDKKVYPELEHEPENQLTKEDIIGYQIIDYWEVCKSDKT